MKLKDPKPIEFFEQFFEQLAAQYPEVMKQKDATFLVSKTIYAQCLACGMTEYKGVKIKSV